MDRIDIFVDVPRVDCDKLTGDGHGETCARDVDVFCHLTSRGKVTEGS